MCKTVSMIHARKSLLDLTNADIARKMSAYTGNNVSDDSVQKIFAGNQGVTLDNLGAYLDSLGLKVVEKGVRSISEKKYQALLMFAQEGIESDLIG